MALTDGFVFIVDTIEQTLFIKTCGAIHVMTDGVESRSVFKPDNPLLSLL